MNKPQFVKVDGKEYKINTDFRVALECDSIAKNKSIGDHERALAIIYKLFGDAGLDCENQNKLIELSLKYISLGKQQKSFKTQPRNNFELDFSKCKGLIASSFKFDYNYNPYELEYLHWYDFYNDLENLSSNDLGTCCVLNRIMNFINFDTSKIKNTKERTELEEAKKQFIDRYCIVKEEKEITKQQEESARELYKSLGIEL